MSCIYSSPDIRAIGSRSLRASRFRYCTVCTSSDLDCFDRNLASTSCRLISSSDSILTSRAGNLQGFSCDKDCWLPRRRQRGSRVLVRVIVHVAVPMPISRAGPADTLMSLREEPRMTTGVLNTGANSRVYEIFGSAGDRGRLTGNGRSDVHRGGG